MKRVAQRGSLVLLGLLIMLLRGMSWSYRYFTTMQIQTFGGNLMWTLITFLLLTIVAIGQEVIPVDDGKDVREKAPGRLPTAIRLEGIPANIGTGELPPGLEGETDLNAIKQRRIEALQDAVEVLHMRYRGGQDNIGLLLAAQNEPAMAKLDATTVKKERLDHIETALASALLTWQSVKGLQEFGTRGGDSVSEAQARAAVFKFRAVWLAEKAAGPQQPSVGQEGIPANVGTGVRPPGLEGETDLNAIKQRRIEALQDAVKALQVRNDQGLDNINFLLAAQIELASAKLDSTTVKKERLDHIETALASALMAWQRVNALKNVFARGGDSVSEAQARAAVFKFRVMWLAEKAASPQQPVIGQVGIPANVGTGVLPPGLEGETDLNAIKQRRIEALQGAVEALQLRYERALDNINFLLATQIELVIANLDSTTVKIERLDHSETALATALITWQRLKELQKVGARGGDAAAEFQARAAVFKFRAMWLAEKAAGPQSPSVELSRVPQSTDVAPSLTARALNSYPILIYISPCGWITETRCACLTTCHRANHRARRYRPERF